jgi:hypothetical protein
MYKFDLKPGVEVEVLAANPNRQLFSARVLTADATVIFKAAGLHPIPGNEALYQIETNPAWLGTVTATCAIAASIEVDELV